MKKFYVTTTLPYVNAEPHIGFAMEIVYADIIARYHREVLKDDVFFNTGTDEHGLKIYRKALDEGKNPQDYVDEYAEKFRKLKTALNLNDDLHFIRTTDEHHKKAAQEFWKLCQSNIDPETGKADIYKDTYKTKYCVGCELEKTDSELVDGKCPIHPNLEIEVIEEENYFFNFKRYEKQLLDLYKRPGFVLPESRLNEIRNFVGEGLNNFSISRLKEKMPWGIPVPGDDKHVMYVWFDALINYISTLDWPENTQKFEEFWGTKEAPNGIQVAGKDQVRQQAAMWQAMLISAGLPTSKQILIHGFVTSGGQKMSKSLGNVVGPYEIIEKYGTDALRYYIAREMNMFDDSDFTWEKFEESYNANLANGLGNLASRIMKMAVTNNVSLNLENVKENPWERIEPITLGITDTVQKALNENRIKDAADLLWGNIKYVNEYIQKTEPFRNIKTNPDNAKKDIMQQLKYLWELGILLEPILPKTSEKILEAIKTNSEIKTPLFPRK